MKKREAALRAGRVEKYMKDGKKYITLYWELWLPPKANKPVGAFTVDVGEGLGWEEEQRHRYPYLEDADHHVFQLRDKTPADLALQVFGVTPTPDDDEEE